MNNISRINVSQIRNGLFSLALLVFISGCDDPKKTNNLNIPTNTVKEHFRATTLNGVVNNDSHPIKNGRIEVTDSHGKIVATYQLKDNTKFQVKIPATAFYPIVLTAFPDSTESEDKQLRVVVVNPAPKYFDITSLTTAIADKALKMGGYTRENLMQAALTGGVAVPDTDRTLGGFKGDPTQQFGGWH